LGFENETQVTVLKGFERPSIKQKLHKDKELVFLFRLIYGHQGASQWSEVSDEVLIFITKKIPS
jgi:hypothetical protein